MAYEAKTKQTKANVGAFLDAVANAGRREDAKTLCALMQEATGETPAMWGPTMVGFGRYRYAYESGHSGEAFRLGFSPRKANLVLYVLTGFPEQNQVLGRLGKHKTGKVCLYLNRLSEIDQRVLRELIERSWAWMNQRYPAAA